VSERTLLRFTLAWTAVVLVFWFGLFVPNMQAGIRRPLEDMDLYGYFLPKMWYGNEEVLAGRLPAWNPWEYAGLPFLAAAQPAALYPLKILVFALVPGFALHAFMVLHYVLAGVFCFVALTGLGLGWAGAVLGTVTWIFSAVNMDSHYHVVRLACLTWVPLVFLSFVRTLERPGPRPATALGVVAALCILAGYPEYMLDAAVTLALFWPLAAWTGALGTPRPPLARTVGWLAVAALLAGALAAPLVLPLAEMVAQSSRVIAAPPMLDPLAFWGWSFLSNAHALRIVLGAIANMFHMAPFAWMLAIVGMLLGRGRFRLPFAAAFFLAVGSATVLGRAIRSIPGFGLFRPTYAWISLAYFPAAYLAGSGLEAVLAGRLVAVGTRARLALGVAVAAVVASAAFLAPRSWIGLGVAAALLGAAWARPAWRTPALLAMVAAVVLAIWAWIPPAIASPEVHRYTRKETPYPRTPPVRTNLASEVRARCGPGPMRVLAPLHAWDGAAVLERVEMLQGYPESLAPRRMLRLLRASWLDAEHGPLLEPNRIGAAARVLDALNVGCVLLPVGQRIDAAALGLEPAGPIGVETAYRRPSALPRAFLVSEVTAVGDEEAAWRWIQRPEFAPGREAVIEAPEHPVAPSGAAGSVRLEDWAPDALRLRVAAPAPTLLVVSQAWYPGWEALVDGRRVPLYRADYVLMALAVPAGDHAVTVRYRPASVRAGLVLGVLGTVALLGFTVVGRRAA
jgi:hypothetical protein